MKAFTFELQGPRIVRVPEPVVGVISDPKSRLSGSTARRIGI